MNRTFSILDCRVVVETNRRALWERLDDIVVKAEDRQPARREIALQLKAAGDAFRILHDGRELARAGDPALAIRTLHLLINEKVLEPQREVLKLHAAAGTWRGRFFFVTGDRGAGKTTLLLKMMLDGAEMHCDETLLLRDGLIQTFPRKFYIKDGTLRCLPRTAEVCAGKRAYPGFYGGRLFFADPTDFGLPWRSRQALPWAIFNLTSAFDQPPRLQPCPEVDMVKYLLLQTINLAGNFAQHVAEVCRFVQTCRCYSLRVGPLEATAKLLQETLA